MDALELRKELKLKKPTFNRQCSGKNIKVGKGWKRPSGIQSKMRLNRKGYAKGIKVGYKSPKAVRGFTAEGFEFVLVSSKTELNKDVKAVVISAGVGMKKRLEILEEAKKLGVKVLNRDLDKELKAFDAKKKVASEKKAKKDSKVKKVEAETKKKEDKKAKKATPKKETKVEKKTEAKKGDEQ
jgi:large subunit ribosomal protein L32e